MQTIDVSALFTGPGRARDTVDRSVLDAASTLGVMTIGGFDGVAAIDPASIDRLLEVFTLDDAITRRMYRRKYDTSNDNVYRGWFALTPTGATYKEGLDIGPDIVREQSPDGRRDAVADGGRIRATEHRVVACGVERYSVPFFFEPRVDAVITPHPGWLDAEFEPFTYGDHLWASMIGFVEFVGISRSGRGS